MFDSGICTICYKTEASVAGLMPHEVLTPRTENVYFGTRSISYTRLYEARGADSSIDKLVRVPEDVSVEPDDYIIIGSDQYRVDAVADGTALYEALGANVYHYFRPTGQIPACVWQESGEDNSFHSGNHKTEQAIRGTVDYYTQTEFDTNADTIQATLDGLGAAWWLESVQYEEDTKIIHYEWGFVVTAERG